MRRLAHLLHTAGLNQGRASYRLRAHPLGGVARSQFVDEQLHFVVEIAFAPPGRAMPETPHPTHFLPPPRIGACPIFRR
jgi:hypothetical protein